MYSNWMKIKIAEQKNFFYLSFWLNDNAGLEPHGEYEGLSYQVQTELWGKNIGHNKINTR